MTSRTTEGRIYAVSKLETWKGTTGAKKCSQKEHQQDDWEVGILICGIQT